MKIVYEIAVTLAHVAALSAACGFGLTSGVIMACVLWG
jgi:hypothetical protein